MFTTCYKLTAYSRHVYKILGYKYILYQDGIAIDYILNMSHISSFSEKKIHSKILELLLFTIKTYCL